MRIKLTTDKGGSAYRLVTDFEIKYSRDEDFWFFCTTGFYSYVGYIYKFETKEAVEKLVEDIYGTEKIGKLAVYNVDKKLRELGILVTE